jgi:hypothetical protein
MTVINLVPSGVLLERESRRALRSWSVRLAACALVLGGAYVGILRVAGGPSAEVRRLSERMEQLQVRFRGAEGLIGERDRLDRRLQAIESISEAEPAGWFLELVGHSLTRESYLNYLELERCLVEDEKSGRGRKDECVPTLTLRGYAPGHSEVGEVLRALKESGAFRDVTLASVSELPGEALQRDVRFHLACRVAER